MCKVVCEYEVCACIKTCNGHETAQLFNPLAPEFSFKF
jgi:hypothetical protein